MVTYSTVRVANFTQYAHECVVRTNIPLAKGVLFPDSGANVTAVDPLNDGVDRPVKYMQYGPLWEDGSYRNLTVEFRAALDAGVHVSLRSDNLEEEYYGGAFTPDEGTAREIAITDDAGTSTSFTLHPAIAARLDQTTIEFITPVTDVNEANPITMRSITSLLKGTFGASYSNGIYSGGIEVSPQQLEDVGPETALYASRSRAYPETLGGNQSDYHSWYQWLAWRAGHNQRWLDVIWTGGPGMITKDFAGVAGVAPNPRNGNPQNWIQADSDITLVIKGPKVTKLFSEHCIKRITRTNLGSGQGWENTIVLATTKNASSATSRSKAYHDPKYAVHRSWEAFQCYPALRMTLMFDDVYVPGSTMTAGDTAALNAFEGPTGTFVEDGTNYPTPIATDWFTKQECYGPFHCLQDYPGQNNIPNPGGIVDSDDAYERAMNYARDQIMIPALPIDTTSSGNLQGFWPRHGKMRDRSFWSDNIFGFPATGRAAAESIGLHQRYWPAARMGAPDLRFILYDLSKEALRPQNYVEQNATPIDPDNHRNFIDVSADPAKWADSHIWSNRVDYRYPRAPNGDNLGILIEVPRPMCSNGSATHYRDNNGPWRAPDEEHPASFNVFYGDLLVGDIFTKHFRAPCLKYLAYCSRQYLDGYRNGVLGQSNAQGSSNWYSQGGGSSRIDGRMLRYIVSVAYLTGDMHGVYHVLERWRTIYSQPCIYDVEPNRRTRPPSYYQTRPVSNSADRVHGAIDKSEFELKGHVLGDNPAWMFENGFGFHNWMFGQIGWGLWPAILALTHTQAKNDYDPTGQYLEEIKTFVLQVGLTIARSCLKPANRTAWAMHNYVDPNWDPNQFFRKPDLSLPGFNIQPSGSFNGIINPATGRHYCGWYGNFTYQWTVASCIVGFEIAQERGDAASMAEFVRVLDRSDGCLPTSPYGSRGWEAAYTNNSYLDFYSVVPNTFKSRSSDTVQLRQRWTNTSSMSGTPRGNPYRVEHTVAQTSSMGGLPTATSDSETDPTVYISATVAQTSTMGVDNSQEPPIVSVPDTYPTAQLSDTIAQTSAMSGFLTEIGPPYSMAQTWYQTSTMSGLLQALKPHYPVKTVYLQFSYVATIYLYLGDKVPAKHQSFEMWANNAVTLQFDGTDASNVNMLEADNVQWRVKRKPEYDAVVIDKSLGSGITVGTDSVTVTLDSTDTNTLEGIYYHECIATFDSRPVTIAVGYMKVNTTLFALSELV